MIVRVKYEAGLAEPVRIERLVPSGGMVGFDPVSMTVSIDIPPDDVPPEWEREKSLTTTETHLGPVIHGASDSAHEAWHSHLDKRYEEHAGKFRPRLA